MTLALEGGGGSGWGGGGGWRGGGHGGGKKIDGGTRVKEEEEEDDNGDNEEVEQKIKMKELMKEDEGCREEGGRRWRAMLQLEHCWRYQWGILVRSFTGWMIIGEEGVWRASWPGWWYCYNWTC